MKNKVESGKISRNAPCPCGSGKKYKRCCLNKANVSPSKDVQYAKKHRIRIKTPEQIEGIRRAGRLVIETLQMVVPHIKPGTVTETIETSAAPLTSEAATALWEEIFKD